MLTKDQVLNPQPHIALSCMSWCTDPDTVAPVEIDHVGDYEQRRAVAGTHSLVMRESSLVRPHLVDLHSRGVGARQVLLVPSDSRDQLHGAWNSRAIRRKIETQLRRGATVSTYRTNRFFTEGTGKDKFAVPWSRRTSPPEWLAALLADKLRLRMIGDSISQSDDFPEYDWSPIPADIKALIGARIEKDGVAVSRHSRSDGGNANIVDFRSLDDPRLPAFMKKWVDGRAPILVERNVFENGPKRAEASIHVNLSHLDILRHLSDPWNAPMDAIVVTVQWAENGAWQGNLISLQPGRALLAIMDEARAKATLVLLAKKVAGYVRWALDHRNNHDERIVGDEFGDGPARGWICFDAFVTLEGEVEVLLTECNPRETAITGVAIMLAEKIHLGILPPEACAATTMYKTKFRHWQKVYDGMNGYAMTRDNPVGGLALCPDLTRANGSSFIVTVEVGPQATVNRHDLIKRMLATAI